MTKYAGYYADVKQARPPGLVDLPQISAQERTTDKAVVELVARYLEGGRKVTVALGWGTDVFNPEVHTNLDDLSDGEWLWPGDAAYYCENYGILPPQVEFLEKIKRLGGVCPEPSEQQILVVAADRRAGEPKKCEPSFEPPLVQVTKLVQQAKLLHDEAVAVNATRTFVDHIDDLSHGLGALRDRIHDDQLTKRDLDNGATNRR